MDSFCVPRINFTGKDYMAKRMVFQFHDSAKQVVPFRMTVNPVHNEYAVFLF